MIQPGGTTIDYVVDGQNRRVGKEVGGVRQWALLYRDSLNPIAQLDGDGNLVSAFVYGTRPNIPDYFTQNGRVYRIVADHLGSPRLVIDAADGTVAERIDYGPWGQVTRRDITGPAGYVPIPFTFAGGIGDVDTGLVRFGARDYDPMTGRWTLKDPIGFGGGDTNLYGYVVGDPVNLFDPEGLLWFGAHFRISYQAARAVGRGRWASFVLGIRTAWVDVGTQSSKPSDTVHHAMAGDGQTPDQAKRAADKLIGNTKLDEWVRLHAAQDRAAPWHYGQPWSDEVGFWEKARHIWNDVFYPDDVAQQALQDSIDILTLPCE